MTGGCTPGFSQGYPNAQQYQYQEAIGQSGQGGHKCPDYDTTNQYLFCTTPIRDAREGQGGKCVTHRKRKAGYHPELRIAKAQILFDRFRQNERQNPINLTDNTYQ
jgi:hypothetical protein